MTSQPQEKQPSKTARALSARLCAVQAVYQIMQNETPARSVLQQYLEDTASREIDGETMVAPDPALLEKILLGVDEQANSLKTVLESCYKPGKAEKTRLDSLLQAILLCAAYELKNNQDLDSPIIINDYLNVAHGFYEQGEVSLVNGILDAAAKILRPKN